MFDVSVRTGLDTTTAACTVGTGIGAETTGVVVTTVKGVGVGVGTKVCTPHKTAIIKAILAIQFINTPIIHLLASKCKGLSTWYNIGVKGLVKLQEDQPGREIVIIRHGQTLFNAQDKIRGWAEVPLDEVGIEQAHDLGEAMLHENVELDGIYSSDLQRSIETSVIVSKITGIPLLGITKDLRPWDVGELTGMDGKKAHKIMAEYARKKPDERLPGGESFNTFKHRFLGGLIARLNSNRGLNLGFTSHSRGERMAHSWIAAGCPDTLEVDLDEFLAEGEEPATAQTLFIDSPLVFT